MPRYCEYHTGSLGGPGFFRPHLVPQRLLFSHFLPWSFASGRHHYKAFVDLGQTYIGLSWLCRNYVEGWRWLAGFWERLATRVLSAGGIFSATRWKIPNEFSLWCPACMPKKTVKSHDCDSARLWELAWKSFSVLKQSNSSKTSKIINSSEIAYFFQQSFVRQSSNSLIPLPRRISGGLRIKSLSWIVTILSTRFQNSNGQAGSEAKLHRLRLLRRSLAGGTGTI